MRYLIKYYKTNPGEQLVVYNLDILDVNKNALLNGYQEDVINEYKLYKLTIGKNGFPIDGIVKIKNIRMMLLVKDTLREALEEFIKRALLQKEY